MDLNTILASTGTTGTILTLLIIFYKAVNHKKCHSRCCGKNLDMEFSVDQMTPPDNSKDKFEKENPIRVVVDG